jgi:hypothetical protein
VRARRAKARERLPSYLEPASRDPQVAREANLFDRIHARAPFRLLSIRAPRQAVLRTSSRLAPLCVDRSCDLPTKKTRDASDRLLPPNRTACTRTSCVPRSWLIFRATGRARRIRHRAAVPGDRMFHDIRERFGGSSCSAESRAHHLTVMETRRGRFSSHGADATEPLTPLSRFRVSSSRLPRLRESCNLTVRPGLRRVGTGRRMSKPPRPPSTPSRESRRFVMTGMPSAGRDSSQDPVAITAPVPRPQHPFGCCDR